jgi:23S rRNA maturation mini-RNase III
MWELAELRRRAAGGIGGWLRILFGVSAGLACAAPGFGFLGVADTSLVTVIADPAEAAHWAAQLESLDQQLTAVRDTLVQANALRAAIGDPAAAVQGIGDLRAITEAMGSLGSAGQTAADLQAAWAGLDASVHAAAVVGLVGQAGGGAGGQMLVFGQSQPRNLDLYQGGAQDQYVNSQARSQISLEQTARQSLSNELAQAWTDYQAAQTETRQQALLAKISQLDAQGQAMEARRRALLDDLALDDRQRRTDTDTSAKASDERTLAESSAVNAVFGQRALDARTQRLDTLQKTVPASTAPDYSGLRLWTTADAAGSQP